MIDNSIDTETFQQIDGLLAIDVVLHHLTVHEVQHLKRNEVGQQTYYLVDYLHL